MIRHIFGRVVRRMDRQTDRQTEAQEKNVSPNPDGERH